MATRESMATQEVFTGTVHKLPDDLRIALRKVPRAQSLWKDITPLARNEWICWIESAKKAETRQMRLEKALERLLAGKNNPAEK